MSETTAAEAVPDVDDRRRGRPRVHVDDAARSRAYRARRAAKREAAGISGRLVEQLAKAQAERAGALARVAELEQLVARQADELRRYRQADGGGADR